MPETDLFAPGSVIAGKYRVDRVLGRGGMAVVLAATHLQLREPVAIKVLHRQVLAYAGALDRFLREARVAMRLRSDHVARVFDIGTSEDGTPFIVMELLRGADLSSLLQEQGPFAVPDAVDAVLQACQAVAEAHAAGVVHRDLKPANLFMCTTVDGLPLVKVLDFGVSKLLVEDTPDELGLTAPSTFSSPERPPGVLGTPDEARAPAGVTMTRAFLGSPYYMAPEQIRSARTVDARADVWALGVILFELVSGERPFHGESLHAITSAILERPPAPLLGPGGPLPELEAALGRCFEKEPSRRYASVRAFAEAIAPFASPAGQISFESIVRMSEREGRSSLPAAARSRPMGDGSPSGDTAKKAAGSRPRRWLRTAGAAGSLALLGGLALLARKASAPRAQVAALDAAKSCSLSECARTNGGKPSRCREDGVCVALESQDCRVFADTNALESVDTVWLGAMLPRDDRSAADADLHAADLAREDFAQMMSGYTRAGGATHVHPIGLVACDDTKESFRPARHLVEEVHVPAILGFVSAAEVVDVGSSLLIPHGVVGVASMSTSPLVTSLPNPPGHPRLIWRTTYSSAETVKVIARMVPELLEPQLRGQPGVVAAGEDIHVAYVRSKIRGGPTFDGMLFDQLRFNGKTALQNGPSYRQIVLGDADDAGASDAKQTVLSLARFAPHVIVLIVPSSANARLLEPLEQAWTERRYRPRYVFMTSIHQELLDWIGKSEERRRRFFGIEPVSSTSVNTRFVMHYNESSPAKVSASGAPNSTYDAFYLLAYATYALGGAPVTGESLASAFARLVPPGPSIDVGPAAIYDAYAALARGERIDLNGATGKLDFDLATGEAPFDHSVLCVGVDDSGKADRAIESGVVFRSAENRLDGLLHCP